MDSLLPRLDLSSPRGISADGSGVLSKAAGAQAIPAVSFRNILEDLGSRLDAGERQTQRAMTPNAGLDSGQLLALQVATYRYTEVVDLAAKLVDKASGAVKTVVQGQ
jgi:hypothetical protein